MKPLDLRPVGMEEILIQWEDGHRSLFSWHFLRLNCPCAGCINEYSGERMIRPESISEDIAARRWTLVGNYAVRLEWSDGHQTGIYSFDYLRKLCPCPQCYNPAS